MYYLAPAVNFWIACNRDLSSLDQQNAHSVPRAVRCALRRPRPLRARSVPRAARCAVCVLRLQPTHRAALQRDPPTLQSGALRRLQRGALRRDALANVSVCALRFDVRVARPGARAARLLRDEDQGAVRADAPRVPQQQPENRQLNASRDGQKHC